MDFNEIKEIIEIDGGKFIIVEQGKPIMVVMSFEDYKNKLMSGYKQTMLKMTQNPGTNNKENLQNIKKPFPKELEEEPLKIEDLPL